MAWVDVKMGSEIIASTGSERRLSRTVGTHVANAMTKWMEHLPYRVTDRQIRCEPRTSAGGSALCRRSDVENPPRVRDSFAGGDEIPASSYV